MLVGSLGKVKTKSVLGLEISCMGNWCPWHLQMVTKLAVPRKIVKLEI